MLLRSLPWGASMVVLVHVAHLAQELVMEPALDSAMARARVHAEERVTHVRALAKEHVTSPVLVAAKEVVKMVVLA